MSKWTSDSIAEASGLTGSVSSGPGAPLPVYMSRFMPRRLFASVAGSWSAQLISSIVRGPKIEFAGTWSSCVSVKLMISVLGGHTALS